MAMSSCGTITTTMILAGMTKNSRIVPTGERFAKGFLKETHHWPQNLGPHVASPMVLTPFLNESVCQRIKSQKDNMPPAPSCQTLLRRVKKVNVEVSLLDPAVMRASRVPLVVFGCRSLPVM